MKRKMNDNSLIISTGFSIFRIPTAVYRHNEKAYAPSVFSIGPYHHGKCHLKPAERIKWNYLLGLLARLRPDDQESQSGRLRSLTKAISRVQTEARHAYREPIGMDTREFIQVLVLDGCFVIELFRKKAYNSVLTQLDDPIFTVSHMLQFLYHDLILLENQVPWLVLEILFALTRAPIIDKELLGELAIEFFGDILSISTIRSPLRKLIVLARGSKHILDLLRNSLVLSSHKIREPGKSIAWQPMPSATSLREAGIILRKAKYSGSILDVRFRKGVLQIPSLLIHENTESLFLNLISFELYWPDCKGLITSYALLLDNLIQTTADMKILCKIRVIRNWLHLGDATQIFNHSYEDYACVIRNNYYAALTTEVERYCQKSRYYYIRRWQVYRGELKRVYFRRPWALISTIAASVMLILTFLQTLFTFLYR